MSRSSRIALLTVVHAAFTLLALRAATLSIGARFPAADAGSSALDGLVYLLGFPLVDGLLLSGRFPFLSPPAVLFGVLLVNGAFAVGLGWLAWSMVGAIRRSARREPLATLN
jgi:hypothetical protein